MSNVADKIVRFLTHGCDGPVTPFVIIARAIDLARDPEIGRVNGLPDGYEADVAEALDYALFVRGWLATATEDGGVRFASGPADPVWYPGS